MNSGEARKRHHRYATVDEDQVCVDDLAVAAQYASIPVPQPAPIIKTDDDNEIDLENDEIGADSRKSETSVEASDPQPGAVQNEDDELEVKLNDEQQRADAGEVTSDDDQSDVDLEEELARMEKGDDESIDHDRPPKTAHEVDAYLSPPELLEAALNVKLTIDAGLTKDSARVPSPQALKPAGRLHHVLSEEFTVVVQSDRGVLLEDGSALWIRRDGQVEALGNIFEVFGPVSQPLYSIRLPQEPQQGRGQGAELGLLGRAPVASVSIPPSSDNTEANGSDERDKKQVEPPIPKAASSDEASIGLAKFLQDARDIVVYYVPESSSVLDTFKIYQSSARGCDASNFYDEEILNPLEIDYSDDEQERMARSKKGRARAPIARFTGSRGPGSQSHSTGDNSSYQVIPRGFFNGQPHPASGTVPPSPHAAGVLPSQLQPQQTQQQEETDTTYYDY